MRWLAVLVKVSQQVHKVAQMEHPFSHRVGELIATFEGIAEPLHDRSIFGRNTLHRDRVAQDTTYFRLD